MTIRKLLLILFLYILLVWIIAVYIHHGDVDTKALTDMGLLWTAVGVGALLVGVLLERVFGWWRLRKTQKPVKPPEAAGGPKVLQEDDAALLSLILEANQRLAQAPGAAEAGAAGVLGLPLFLALGPERAGKTAVIQNSGLDPALLSGQVLGSTGAVATTKVANMWLAHQSLLLEISGRVFSSERLGEFLSLLQPAAKSGWKAWLGPQQPPVQLRGVLLFFDVREFMGTPEPSKLDRATQTIRARLLSAASVFGAEFPVYCLFTNTDALPYFDDFFNSMTPEEAGQVLGVLVQGADKHQGQVWPEAETKRLNQFFQALFLRLSDRRLIALSQETDPSRRPSIYEFPREFRRIRAPLVQFLVDVFKPDPLKVGPQLRGVFFTGTRKVEDARPAAAAETNVPRPRGSAPDATQFFAMDAGTTMLFRKSRLGSGRLVERWVFATEFFQKILSLDRPFVRPIAMHSKFTRQREIATAVAAGLGVLLALIWTISWFGNWGLVSDTQSAAGAVVKTAGNSDLTVENLRALDRLREQLLQLEQNSPWHLHWGLYTGGDLREAATRIYFARLKQLSLERIDRALGAELQRAGSPEQKDDAGVVYDRLKTVRTIAPASGACEVEQPRVLKVLRDTVSEAHKGIGDTQRALLDTQLRFYVTELAANKTLPLTLAEDTVGVQTARAYVRKQNDLGQRLQGLLSEIGGQVKPLAVPADYRTVLTGQTTFPGAFTTQGQLIFEDRVAHDNFGSEERCVMGESTSQQVMQRLDTGERDRLRSLYYIAYKDAWRDFLKSYSVNRFNSLQDAALKLGALSDARSPLLGIVRMAAENTNFPPPKPGELDWWEKNAQKIGLGGLLQTKADGEKKLSQIVSNSDAPLMTPADVAALFKPVLITTPPAELWVNPNNTGYVDGLRKLREGLETYDRVASSEKQGALAMANAALLQARAAHAALADKFPEVGKEGVNKVLSDLLKQPIDFAAGQIPANMEISSGKKKNDDLKDLCNNLKPILAKYPFTFNAKTDADASLNEVERAFAPISGLVWKYVQKSASDIVVLNKDQVWVEVAPPVPGLKVDPGLLEFLTAAQGMKRAFFNESGGIQAQLHYTLRRVQNQTVGVRLSLDGQELGPDEVVQKSFRWPPAAGATGGAEGTEVFTGGGSAGFGKFSDLWAVFRLFQNADERPLLQKEVRWSYSRGEGGAARQQMNPPPKIEVLDFPGGVDLFNPKFFEQLRCPLKAVSVN